MSTHCTLSESGVTNSRLTHLRKGREGKGRGREDRAEGPIHRFGSRGTPRRRMDGGFAKIRGRR